VVYDRVNEDDEDGLRLGKPDLDGEVELVVFKESVGSGLTL
jgi:hypothetical protein